MLIYLISFITAFIGPLVIWLIKKDQSDFVDYHGKEYFNFLLSYVIYNIISAILMIVLIGFLGFFILGIMMLVFTIVAAVKAWDGVEYRIPLTIKFFR
nr:DUF4870 domain-containing protein [Shouchella shacheensis]